MACIAADSRLILLMTVDAPFHLDGLLQLYCLLHADISMTALALDLRDTVSGVAEKNKLRYLVDAA
jgi:hypothetical protein